MSWRSQERIVRGMNAPPEIEAAHVGRYRFAVQTLPHGLALDCGCGSGYGTELLAEAGWAVIAGDVATDAVAMAMRHHPAGCYVVLNAEALPFEDGSFDAVTCFEIIEHVWAPDRLCAELARVLKPGGMALLSTPPPYSPHEQTPNPFHLRLYTDEELAEQLAPHFQEVRILGQCPPFDPRLSASFHPLNRLVVRLKRKLGIRHKLVGQRIWNALFRRLSPGPEWAVQPDDLSFDDDRLEHALSLIAVCRKAS